VATTSVTLLDRLKAAGPDDPGWRRLHDLYRPLVRHWIARAPALAGEADDLAQEVLFAVARELPRFERRRDGSFRAWLRTITANRVRQFWRDRRRRPPAGAADGTDQFLSRLADPAGDLAAEWDRDHDRHVFQKLLTLVEPDFAPATWAAFRRFALDGQPAAAVAADLGLSENAVLLAKARVLKRLREEAAGLID